MAAEHRTFPISRRRFVQSAGAAGLALLGGRDYIPFHAQLDARQPQSLGGDHTARKSEGNQLSEGARTAGDILGGHDVPNPGGSKHVQEFVSDLKALGMKTAVCIDPSTRLVRALDQARIRLIARLVQTGNVFDEPSILWTLTKLEGVRDVGIQPFNEPNVEGVVTSPEDHVRGGFMRAARVILPRIAPCGGTLLLTPLAPYANFQGMDEYCAYRQMIVALKDELAHEHAWMWSHISIGAHAYSYYLGDDRIWDRIQRLFAIAREVTGRSLPIEITEAGLNISWPNQYTDEQIQFETVAMLQSSMPSSLAGIVRSFCLWVTANYAQRDEWHQSLDTDQQELQIELNKFETAALRRLDGVTPTYLAIKNLTTVVPP
jgi:hypothetical protein